MKCHSRWVHLLALTLLPGVAVRAQASSDPRPIKWEFGVAHSGSHVIERSRLGSADAVSVVLPMGRIVVVGLDINEIRYTIQHTASITFDKADSVRLSDARRRDSLALARDEQHTYLAPRIQVSFPTWNFPIFPDTTAVRKLRVFEGEYQEVFSATGLRLTLPKPSFLYSDTTRMSGIRYSEFTIVEPGTAKSNDNNGLEIRLEVPRNLSHLSLVVEQAGRVIVQDFNGELTVTSAKGDVHLGYLGGPAVVETAEGNIYATLKGIPMSAMVSLMSGKGDVKVLLAKQDSVQFNAQVRGGEFRRFEMAPQAAGREATLIEAPSRTTAPEGVRVSMSTNFILFPAIDTTRGSLTAVSKRYVNIRTKVLVGDIVFGSLPGTIPRWLK